MKSSDQVICSAYPPSRSNLESMDTGSSLHVLLSAGSEVMYRTCYL